MLNTIEKTDEISPCYRTIKQLSINETLFYIKTTTYEITSFFSSKDLTPSLFELAKSSHLFPKMYLSAEERSVALGKEICFSTPPSIEKTTLCNKTFLPSFSSFFPSTSSLDPFPIKIYGASDFFLKRKTTLWNGFPLTFFFLPKIEIKENSGKLFLILHEKISPEDKSKQGATGEFFAANQQVTHFLEDFIFSYKNKSKPQKTTQQSAVCKKAPSLESREDTPSKKQWIKNIQKSLENIEQNEMLKIVPARKTTLSYSKNLSPFSIAKKLEENAKNAAIFCLQIEDQKAFIGATPELLYDKEKEKLQCVALAGTRALGKTEKEDLFLQKTLEENEKENREFLQVSDVICELLRPICTQIELEKTAKVLKTTNMQHLFHLFKAKLDPNITNQTLIKVLHPTPATSGNPNKKVLDILYQLEQFDRGYYAAPIGYVSEKKTKLYVGIRSGLVIENQLHLFAGTGIVKGSSPEKEWEELELKIKQFL